MLSMIYPTRKEIVDDSGFREDTQQTTRVIWLPCAVIRILEDNDEYMWAI